LKSTRSLAGKLSLWSVEKTQVASAKADALKQEWDVKFFITFYKFSVTEVKPVERRKNVSSLGKSGRIEVGMGRKSL